MIRLGMRKDAMSRDFEALVGPYVEEMYRVAAAIVGPEDAPDVTQDALLAAWRGLPRLRNTDRTRPWLHSIVANTCRNHLRSRGRRPKVIQIDAAALRAAGPVDDASASVADRDRLDRAFETLTADQRVALALHYTIDLSVPDVAAILGIPDGTAKSRIHSAVQRMRVALGEQER